MGDPSQSGGEVSISAALLGRSKAVALESQMTLRRKKRCSAVLESLSMVWRRRWTSGCPLSFSTKCESELAAPFTFLWGDWGDGQGEDEAEGGAGAMNFTTLVALLLSDIPPLRLWPTKITSPGTMKLMFNKGKHQSNNNQSH